jgi:ABC-type branched-subunit amino acid transport system ATPase component
MSVLEVESLTKHFGGITALDDVDFTVEEGEILGVIGPNGAGKTTMINTILGLIEPDRGEVKIAGEVVTDQSPHSISRRGVSKTFQRVRLFPGQTAFECLLIGLQEHQNTGLVNKLRAHTSEERARAEEMLSFLDLDHLRDEDVENLSYGQQKLLDFGVAMISGPEVVFLDEPVGGVNPSMVKRMEKNILRARDEEGTTFVIVEHNVDLVMRLCERIVVLNNGQVLFMGPPQQVREEQSVIEAYFGG